MDVAEQLKTLTGRVVDTIPHNLQGKPGFIAEYFNYSIKNSISEIFSETKEGALLKLLTFLEKQPGEEDGTSTRS